MKRLLIALALLAAGCVPPVKSGTVVEKTLEPAHVEEGFYYITVGQISTPVFYEEQIPDKWFVTVSAKTGDGKTRTGRMKVTKEAFEQLKLGDLYGVEK